MIQGDGKDAWVDPAETWKRFHGFLQLLIVGAGLLVVSSSGYAIYRGAAIYQRYFPLVKASMEMQLAATTAYLWFEEMIGGDRTKTLDDILPHLDLAERYAKALFDGGADGHPAILPLADAALQDAIAALQRQLAQQRELLISRINVQNDAGPGSGIDQRYHATLEDFLATAGFIEMRIEQLIAQNFDIFKNISVGVMIFCVILFLILGLSFFRYESLRRRNVADIVDMHRLLIHQEKMASLGTMMAGIAHEVNNPNSFITLNVPLLKEAVDEILPIVDDHARRHPDAPVLSRPYAEFRRNLLKTIENIGSGADRIQRMVSTLMNFSRNRQSHRMTWFNIRDTIAAVSEICRPQMAPSVRSFDVIIDENVPEKIFFDPEILEISLVNLLNNAAAAADKPDAWVALRVGLKAAGNGHSVVIEVEDNGRGIKKDDLQKIFEPFYTTRSTTGGTGLGLYLCYTLLHENQAAITVESEEGAGSIFRVTLSR